jgi:mannose-1-phosphate guanylyltransferase
MVLRQEILILNGYVKIDKGSKVSNGVIDYYQVNGYFEKPEAEKATEYVRSGEFLWHCFGFTVQVNKLISVIAKYDPATYEILLEVEKDLRLPSRLEEFNLAKHYSKIVESNIENKVLENLDQPLFVVTMESTWSDVGAWDHVYEILTSLKKDLTGTVRGKPYSIDSNNNLVINNGQPVSLIGVHDLVIVVTDKDLILSKEESQKVKQMVNLLKEKDPELL